MNATFRCDATAAIGGGHVYRCLVLADALATAGWSCAFATAAESGKTVPELSDSGHRIVWLNEAGLQDPRALPVEREQQIDLLVVDHYGLDASYERAGREHAARIMAIDDLATRDHDCDVLLDQTLGRRPDEYAGRVPAGCRLLLGPSFALLRTQFADARRSGRPARHANGRRRMLISFGAIDGRNLSALALQAVLRTGHDLEIDVVMGPAARSLAAVRRIADSQPARIRVHVGVADMAALMAGADLAVGAGGTTAWERCCLGLPTVIIVTAANQRRIADELANAGAALVAGEAGEVTDERLAAVISRLLQTPETLLRMSQAAAAICDGEGARRVCRELGKAA